MENNKPKFQYNNLNNKTKESISKSEKENFSIEELQKYYIDFTNRLKSKSL